jgi:hypothetical protein
MPPIFSSIQSSYFFLSADHGTEVGNIAVSEQVQKLIGGKFRKRCMRYFGGYCGAALISHD